MKKVYKKKIVITGSSGLLGSYFANKYKKKFQIIKYPNRIENFKKFQKWIMNKKFDYFIHFAAITRNSSMSKKKLFLINTLSVKNILNSLNKHKKNNLKYFLFISSSHVYGNYNKKIKENQRRNPLSDYGKSKKMIEDFVFKKRKNFFFKIGIARIFNFTGPNQRRGYFIPDMSQKLKKFRFVKGLNKYRDFIHIDDLMESLKLLIKKEFEPPINISSGKKVNLIDICKLIVSRKKIENLSFEKNRGEDIYGNNSLLKKLGKKKFKSINSIIKTYYK